MVEKVALEITKRELLAIQFSLYYADCCEHGTVGHNLQILVAKLARDRGFALDDEVRAVILPENVMVTEKAV